MQNSRLIVVVVFFLLAACGHADTRKRPSASSFYFNGRIEGEEGKEEVTCLFQFLAGANGAPVNFSKATVQLDGKILVADSAHFSGQYYEAIKTLAEFSGVHEVAFSAQDMALQKEKFVFPGFALATELPEKIKRHPFTIAFKNIGDPASLRLVMMDTAFAHNGINQLVPVINGKLTVDEKMLRQLKSGPVFLTILLERESPVQNGKVNGRIATSYSLNRQFELVD